MRKAAAFILTFLYLSTVIGGTLHQHFCMGRLIGVDVWQQQTSAEKTCPQCGMTKKKGCCEDNDRLMKTEKQPDILQSSVSVPQSDVVAVKNYYCIFQQSFNSLTSQTLVYNNSPPGLAAVPIHILNCAYRI